MKVDGLGIILVIILLPIIMVVTYYIQLQVDTIATENSYNTKLLDATYDAMSAFEINTANEELSSVADSMRSIVLASNNTFFNTLATNLGMSNASQENLRPYIPAILYTMYDGYYIYAPTETAVVAEKTETDENGLITTKGYLKVGEDGVKYSNGYYSYDPTSDDATYNENDPTSIYGAVLYETNTEGQYTNNKDDANVKKETDYVLKPYTQYSARYKNDEKNIDVTINYTLDNYLNIEGTVDGIYYTKTGYLIKDGLVSGFNIDDSMIAIKNESDAKEKILGVKTNAPETTINAASNANVTVNGQTIEVQWNNICKDGSITTISEAEEKQEKGELSNVQIYEIQKYKAIAYYVSSYIFSNWVYDNLGDLQYQDIQDDTIKDYLDATYRSTSGVNDLYYNFDNNDTTIFYSAQDPEDTTSNFNTHKMEVIKNSIKYNLNLSISAYCKMKGSADFSMPVLTDEEWDKILSNISIVSFMQGWDCGLDVYNNYQVAYSTNNELTVTPSEIYYVGKNAFNKEDASYHRIDCPDLGESNDGYIAFKSKEVKYDKLYDKSTGKYKYDHKNLACYTCINNNNYKSLFEPKDSSYYTDGRKYTSYYDRINSLENNNKKLAGYIGIAKERMDTYKMNALPVSEGYKMLSNFNTNFIRDYEYSYSFGNDNIKQLQITFSNIKLDVTQNMTTGTGVLKINGKEYILALNNDNNQTVTIDIDSNTKSIKLIKEWDGWYKIESIKAIYN